MGTRIDKQTFLERAEIRFGNRYDYTSIEYRSYRSPIKIRCKEHPVRLIVITPERHLETTGGCKYCLKSYRNGSLERTRWISPPSSQEQALGKTIRSDSHPNG